MVPETDDGSTSTASSTSSSAEPADTVSDMAEQKDGVDRRNPATKSSASSGASNGGKSSAAANAKDPMRPRRKKARRACFACQRAHLTCGDERPCQRCIKRGLQDSCHDGMRKKAKYLHDAPPEALMPGIGGGHFTPMGHMGGVSGPMSSNLSSPDMAHRSGGQGNFFPPPSHPTTTVYGVYPQNTAQVSMATSMTDFAAPPQSSPLSPVLHQGRGSQQLSGLPGASLPPSTHATPVLPQDGIGGPLYDPNDPTLFNFDLASLNFGNHYGALEFGMLGHMSSGAADLSPGDNAMQQQGGPGFALSHTSTSSGYMQSPESTGFGGFGQDTPMEDWPPQQTVISGSPQRRPSISSNVFPRPANTNGSRHHASSNGALSHSYNVSTSGATPSLATSSQASSPQDLPVGSFDTNAAPTQLYPPTTGDKAFVPPPAPPQAPKVPSHFHPRDPSTIYTTITSPYPYTAGFHRLTAVLQRRFPPAKTLQIAKALASIRPSFISCTKSLDRHDLVFMEQCFQRTLWEYENLINKCGTPTIVCRRTGEVAAVGKEFSVMTGWSRGVLLGEEGRGDVGGSGKGRAGTRGVGADGVAAGRVDSEGRPQPVFLAELLDDDSVVEFYEDFAKLAFGDSRGCVQRRGRVLKYKPTATISQGAPQGAAKKEDSGPQRGKAKKSKNAEGAVKGHEEMSGLESEDGRLECTYCWTVKRDMFDIPMLIVINFLPCIWPD